MNIKAGIYKITSPFGKIYIGQSININSRINQYKSLFCKDQYRLYNSLKKYGFENHTIEIVKECDKSELNHFEAEFIKQYDTFNTDHGMNLTSGGDSHEFSEESKVKKSNSLKETYKNFPRPKGKDHPLYGRKVSEKYIKRGKDNGMFGKTFSDDIKKQWSKERSGKLNPMYYTIDNESFEYAKKSYLSGNSLNRISKQINTTDYKLRSEFLSSGIKIRSISEQKSIDDIRIHQERLSMIF